MKVKICSCLLVSVLTWILAAGIIQRQVREKQQIILLCPQNHSKVTWTRETDGTTVNIFTIDGDNEIRHNDPGRRYSSQADKSLVIGRVSVSDTGKYFCNNEPVVELTVISENNATTSTTTTTTTTTSATTTSTTTTTTTSATTTSTTTPTTTSATTTSTTTTTTTTSATTPTTSMTTPTTTLSPPPTTTSTTTLSRPGLMVTVLVSSILLLLLLLVLIACRVKRRRGAGSADCCAPTLPGGPNLTEPVYATISDLPPAGQQIALTSLSTESPYSVIMDTLVHGANQGLSRLIDSTYVLLEKPRTAGNSSEQ